MTFYLIDVLVFLVVHACTLNYQYIGILRLPEVCYPSVLVEFTLQYLLMDFFNTDRLGVTLYNEVNRYTL